MLGAPLESVNPTKGVHYGDGASALERSRCYERLLHAGPAYAAGRLRSATAGPVRLQRDGVAIAGGLERAELRRPVHVAHVDGRPATFALRVRYHVLTVAVQDSILRQHVPAGGVDVRFSHQRSVARVPRSEQRR